MPVADPVMTVAHEGKTYQVVVRPGPEGRDEFEQTIRRIFRLSPGDSISLTFGCALPQAARDDPVLGVCVCVGSGSCAGICEWGCSKLQVAAL